MSRLIEADIVERVVQAGQDVDTGTVVDSATYRLTEDFMRDLGATTHPEHN